MKAYMVFAAAPPPGLSDADELLVSLTRGDVAEEYDEWYHDPEIQLSWEELPIEVRDAIFSAFLASGVDMAAIFDTEYPRLRRTGGTRS